MRHTALAVVTAALFLLIAPEAAAMFTDPSKVTVKGQRADQEQLRVFKRALGLADRWGVKSYKARKALIEALIVESEARNLKTPSADGYGSYGVLQGLERYHKRSDLLDPAYQIGVFLGHGRGGKKTGRKGFTGEGNARSLSKTGRTTSGKTVQTSGQVAQAIEGSAYPHRYDQVGKEAAKILKLWQGGTQVSRGTGAESDAPRTKTTTGFDGTGFEKARRQSIVAQLIAKRDPDSMLLRTGAISTEQPDPANYVTQQEVKVPAPTRKTPRRNNRGGATLPGAGGDWGGTESPIIEISKFMQGFGLQTTSGKRPRKSTASGGISDHWVGSTNSQARDWSNGSAPTPEMDEAAYRLARRLGIKDYKKGTRLERTVTRNGIRYQVLYRTSTGGNHFNHVHLGLKRV